MELDFSEKNYNILQGDVLERLKDLDDDSVDCVVTSPPYFNLRDYHAEGQIGMEKTPEEYVQKMVDVFREVRRVLKDTGTVWLNIGDSYCNSNGFARLTNEYKRKGREGAAANDRNLDALHEAGYKDKDLIGIPWMLAFALRNDGWYLRQDIIWCLSEYTMLYVRENTGYIRQMSIRELASRTFTDYSLWNGKEWTAVTNIRKSDDPGKKIELIMGNGESIGTTLNHRWILKDGTEVEAKDLKEGDVLKKSYLPDEQSRYPFRMDRELLWMSGVYMACGDRRKNEIAFTMRPWQRMQMDNIERIVQGYGGKVEYEDTDNNVIVYVDCGIVRNAIDKTVWGNNACEKHLMYDCWGLSNKELAELMVGYFNGIGCAGPASLNGYSSVKIPYEAKNNGWRTNLRSLAARLGAVVTVKWEKRNENDKYYFPVMMWRLLDDLNFDDDCTIARIRDCSAENFYDITVDCDEHMYCLESGIMTHNCKPNPLPESVSDRCTKAHEYIFLLSKSKQYYFDYEAIEEEATGYDGRKDTMLKGSPKYENAEIFAGQRPQTMAARGHQRWKFKESDAPAGKLIAEEDKKMPVRRKRDVWVVPTKSFSGAHFATFPEKLIEPCILAGCPEGGVVLDIFNGAATTGMVSLKNGRKYVGIEINPEYVKLSKDRLDEDFYNPNWII